jgi:hypothetical protein
MYIYTTSIYKDTTNVFGIDITANTTAKTDFETNFKATAILVQDIIFAETSIVIVKTYTQFKALIDGTVITWADVKYVDEGFYDLHLLSGTPL